MLQGPTSRCTVWLELQKKDIKIIQDPLWEIHLPSTGRDKTGEAREKVTMKEQND